MSATSKSDFYVVSEPPEIALAGRNIRVGAVAVHPATGTWYERVKVALPAPTPAPAPAPDPVISVKARDGSGRRTVVQPRPRTAKYTLVWEKVGAPGSLSHLSRVHTDRVCVSEKDVTVTGADGRVVFQADTAGDVVASGEIKLQAGAAVAQLTATSLQFGQKWDSEASQEAPETATVISAVGPSIIANDLRVHGSLEVEGGCRIREGVTTVTEDAAQVLVTSARQPAAAFAVRSALRDAPADLSQRAVFFGSATAAPAPGGTQLLADVFHEDPDALGAAVAGGGDGWTVWLSHLDPSKPRVTGVVPTAIVREGGEEALTAAAGSIRCRITVAQPLPEEWTGGVGVLLEGATSEGVAGPWCLSVDGAAAANLRLSVHDGLHRPTAGRALAVGGLVRGVHTTTTVDSKDGSSSSSSSRAWARRIHQVDREEGGGALQLSVDGDASLPAGRHYVLVYPPAPAFAALTYHDKENTFELSYQDGCTADALTPAPPERRAALQLGALKIDDGSGGAPPAAAGAAAAAAVHLPLKFFANSCFSVVPSCCVSAGQYTQAQVGRLNLFRFNQAVWGHLDLPKFSIAPPADAEDRKRRGAVEMPLVLAEAAAGSPPLVLPKEMRPSRDLHFDVQVPVGRSRATLVIYQSGAVSLSFPPALGAPSIFFQPSAPTQVAYDAAP